MQLKTKMAKFKSGVFVMSVTLALASTAASLSGCDNKPATTPDSVYLLVGDAQKYTLSQDALHPAKLTLPLQGLSIVTPVLSDDIAVQVCASADASILTDPAEGKTVDTLACFAPGTGMAAELANGPEHATPLYVADGNSSNYYSVERREKRADKLVIHINDVQTVNDDGVQPLNDAALASTSLAIFIDSNANDQVDANETWFAQVKWL